MRDDLDQESPSIAHASVPAMLPTLNMFVDISELSHRFEESVITPG